MISLFRIYKSNIATNFFFHLLVTQTQNVFNQSVCIFSSFSQYYNAYFIYAIRQLVDTCIVIILWKIFFFSYHYYLFFFFLRFNDIYTGLERVTYVRDSLEPPKFGVTTIFSTLRRGGGYGDFARVKQANGGPNDKDEFSRTARTRRLTCCEYHEKESRESHT